MNKIENVLICGIGAIGAIYADKISRYNNDNLRILVDKKRLENYRKNPKIFNGKELKLNYILPDNKDFKADLIIIATKYDGFFEAVKNIENFVKEDTIILSLLNGVTSESYLAQKYGWKHIIHSYFIGHSSMREGNKITFDGNGDIVFGVQDSTITDKNDEILLKDYFDKAEISYKISQDIKRSMWLKFMLNVSSNQISAILHLTFGQMQKSEKIKNLLKNIMLEVIEIAEASGVTNTHTMLEDAFKSLDKMCPEGKTSMLQDIEAGRKTEVEMFAGAVIEMGKKHGIPTPYNNLLKQMIEIIE
ncbi:ketopantoate reductase family protein [bacterium]|nr:ketopantoate reductase family protein [bacterium]